MCKHLNVSRNAYYVWKNKGVVTKKKTKREEVKTLIHEAFLSSNKTYGSPRIRKYLLKQGFEISRSYVAKIMKDEKIIVIPKKKYVVTTDSNHKYPASENLLNRNFNPKELGKVWVSDITYIKVKGEDTYLTTMIDLADRQVIGWSLSTDMTYENTVLNAWNKARRRRKIKSGFLFHSDRGVQYACNRFRSIFSMSNKMQQSMSRKGNCWDNAVAESFFKTIKTELIYRKDYQSFKQLYQDVYNYIENWYNVKRMHSSLEYRTPLEMELELKGYINKAA